MHAKGARIAIHVSTRVPAPRQFLHGEPRSVAAAALAVIVLASLQHDRAAHRGGTEGDDEGAEQDEKRDAGFAVGEDQFAQMSGVQPEQPADEQHGRAGTDRKVDGEQAEQGNAEQGKGRHGSGLDSRARRRHV